MQLGFTTDPILAAIRDDKVHLLGWYKLDTTAQQRLVEPSGARMSI